MSRIQTLRAGTARTAQLAAAIRAAADQPTITVVRLQLKYTRYDRPYRDVAVFNAKFWQLGLDRDAVDIIDLLIRGGRPDIDWRHDHDWHLDTGMLRRSPGVTDNGYIPEEDRMFGGTAPVFLVDAAPAPTATGTEAVAA